MKQRKHWYHLVVIATLLMTAIGPYINFSSAVAANEPAQTSTSLKLLVNSSDVATLKDLASSGAILQADYGTFSVWKIAGNQRSLFANRPSVSVREDFYTIGLRDSVIDTSKVTDDAVPTKERQIRTNESQLWLVQFVGPIQDAWLADLQKLGLELVIYMPENAYVVWGDGAALTRLDSLLAQGTSVQWVGAYHPTYRLAPELKDLNGSANPAAKGGASKVTVQFFTTGSTGKSLDRLRALGGKVYKAPTQVMKLTNITLEVPSARVAEIATWPDVYNVEHWGVPEKLDEAQGVILSGNVTTSGGNVVPAAPGYLAFLASKGFPTTQSSYPVVDVVDDGLDRGNGANVIHPDFHELGVLASPDRVPYIGNCTTDANGNAVGGHGNLNAGIVAAYNNLTGSPHVDANGYRLGLGISPFGRVAGTKIFRNAGAYDISGCSNTDQGVVAASFNAGANLTSNSWGCGPPNCGPGGVYDASSQAYDALTRDASANAGNQQMLHVFSAGNSGSAATTLGTPGTAKNVISVGATENVRDEGTADGCGLATANNADDVAGFSSRGPTTDQRIKPDIIAPGTHVQGPASQDVGFNGTGVCGGAGNPFYPPAQTLYTWSSGTSHSAPAVAGTASLVYEYYGRVISPGQTPSPAMIKALIVNTPRYLAAPAVGAGGNLPTNNQGWGDVNLGAIFDGTQRKVYDQNNVFGASGDSQTYTGFIATPSKPFHVSLVWTDAPGATSGNSFVNNLDLEVTAGGQTYKGNVFTGANSTTGGTADTRNNVEGVFLPAGVSGSYTVRVIGTNIAGDGVAGNADVTDQDYALVVYNGGFNPNLPNIRWSTATQTVAENVGNVTLTASLTATYTATVSLQFQVSGTAANPADHNLPVTGTLTIPAGQTSASTSFAVVNDTLDEDNETVIATIAQATNANIVSPAVETVTITDDDPSPTVAWTSAAQTVAENVGTVTATVQLSAMSGREVSVPFTVGGTATNPADHNLISGTITIPVGSLTASRSFQVVNDALDEANETVVLTAGTPVGATLGSPAAHTVTITDDDATPTVNFGLGGAATQVFSYTGAPVAIPDANAAGVNTTITVSGFNGGVTDLNFAIGGTVCSATIGSTTVGLDHTWVGDLVFVLTSPEGTTVRLIDRPGAGVNGANGNNFCQTVLDDEGSFPSIESITNTGTPPLGPPYTGSFSPQNPFSAFDGEDPNGTWTLNVSDNAGQDTGTLRDYSLTISAPTFQPDADQTVSELAGQVTVSAGLSAASGQAVSVPFTVSGTATNPADHNLANGTIVIPAGQTSANVVFNLVNDGATEGTETVILTMGTPVNAIAGSTTVHTVNVIDGGVNTAPTATPTGNLSVEQEAGPVSGAVATVSDGESPASALTVAVSGAPNGMTVSVVNNNGTVTATAAATCDVPTGVYTITLTVTDPGGLTATSTFTVTVTGPTAANVIVDGSFEAGTPSTAWTEASTNFGTPLCDAACGNSQGTAGPRTGTWWAWFGGTANAETGSMSQAVSVPTGAILEFYIRYGRHSGGGAGDYFKITANGTEIWRIDDTTTTYDGATYTRVEVSLAAFAGQSVTLLFEQHNEAATPVTVINIDDVAVLGSGDCVPSDTQDVDVAVPDSTLSGAPNAVVNYTVTVTNTGTTTDTFDLTLGTHVWTTTLGSATVGPLASGASTTVTVSVTVPAAATNGQTDSVTVTATSQTDNTATAAVTLTTTADVTTPVVNKLYMPVIIR